MATSRAASAVGAVPGLTRLTVYGRVYCHLCDEMIAALRALPQAAHFSIEMIDVDAEPALEARYGDRVPVLVADGRELCQYRLDAGAIAALSAGIG